MGALHYSLQPDLMFQGLFTAFRMRNAPSFSS
jgi:hypothetical protein